MLRSSHKEDDHAYERNGWRTVGFLVIGAYLGVCALIATAKVAKLYIEKQEQRVALEARCMDRKATAGYKASPIAEIDIE